MFYLSAVRAFGILAMIYEVPAFYTSGRDSHWLEGVFRTSFPPVIPISSIVKIPIPLRNVPKLPMHFLRISCTHSKKDKGKWPISSCGFPIWILDDMRVPPQGIPSPRPEPSARLVSTISSF